MEIFYLGVDVSKKKLDLCLRKDGKEKLYDVIPNDIRSISRWLKGQQCLNGVPFSSFVVCAEYTGMYTYPLVMASSSLGVRLCLEDGARIKYSDGIRRGKSDSTDARLIASYAERYSDVLKPCRQEGEEVSELKRLYSDRSMLITDRSKYAAQLKDQKNFTDKRIYREKFSMFRRLIAELDRCIADVESKIRAIVCGSPLLCRCSILLKSIDGIGEWMSVKMIIETDAFRSFDFNPRKFCCHAGVAPFCYTSGSSQRSRSKVSNRADKSIKWMLHMCALSCIRMNGSPLREYYERKVAEGKNKMAVINALRAKLVFIMFAVVKNDTPFDRFFQNNLCKP